jgi:hypothetical protein
MDGNTAFLLVERLTRPELKSGLCSSVHKGTSSSLETREMVSRVSCSLLIRARSPMPFVFVHPYSGVVGQTLESSEVSASNR